METEEKEESLKLLFFSMTNCGMIRIDCSTIFDIFFSIGYGCKTFSLALLNIRLESRCEYETS